MAWDGRLGLACVGLGSDSYNLGNGDGIQLPTRHNTTQSRDDTE